MGYGVSVGGGDNRYGSHSPLPHVRLCGPRPEPDSEAETAKPHGTKQWRRIAGVAGKMALTYFDSQQRRADARIICAEAQQLFTQAQELDTASQPAATDADAQQGTDNIGTTDVSPPHDDVQDEKVAFLKASLDKFCQALELDVCVRHSCIYAFIL